MGSFLTAPKGNPREGVGKSFNQFWPIKLYLVKKKLEQQATPLIGANCLAKGNKSGHNDRK